MYTISLLSSEVEVTNWKVSGGIILMGDKYEPVTLFFANLQAVSIITVTKI